MHRLRVLGLCMTFGVFALFVQFALEAQAVGKGETKEKATKADKGAKGEKAEKSKGDKGGKADKSGGKADKHEPKADKKEPKADKHEPKADKKEPKADKHEPKTDKKEPKADKHEPKKDKKEPKTEPEPVGPILRGIAVLRAVNAHLENADHDYGGHRHDAIKDVNNAENQLKAVVGAAKSKATDGGGGETQGLSNLQLAKAVPELKITKAFLAKAKSDYGGHRDSAVRDLDQAIGQLETALRFEKGEAPAAPKKKKK